LLLLTEVLDIFERYSIIMKRFLLLITTVVSALIGYSQPQKARADTQKVVADKIAGVVGDRIILRSDLINEILDRQRRNENIPDNANCLVMEQALALKALVLQAEKDSLQVSDEELESQMENQIRGFIQSYGSKEALEQIAGRTVYQIKEDMRVPFKERKLAELMRNKIVDGNKITPNEVKAFYDKIPKDSLLYYDTEVEIGEIVVYPKASRELEKYAQDELTEFKRQVESAERKFETLASLYTDDPGSKQSGGGYNINRTEKSWDPAFLNGAFRLKEGQVSPIIKSKFGYHIIQMVSRAGDDAFVRHILKIPQITDEDIKQTITRLDSVKIKLVSGNIGFGEAVAKYSDDESSKYTGGMRQCANGTYCQIDQLDKDIIPVLKELKPGEYSEPKSFTDERGKKGVRIVYLKTRTEPHRENLKDDYNKVAQRALEEKKSASLEKWFNEKIPTYYIMIDDEFQSCPEMIKWKTVKR
jgi:peptidyl-prolyl cis-trans isomerase SurA